MAMGEFALDRSGLAIPQTRLLSRAPGFEWRFAGHITYRCHTCGELITRPWECLFVDDTPGREWASEIAPVNTTPRTTTHHAIHMAA